MEILKSYHYMPSSPLEMAIVAKKLIKREQIKDINEFEGKIEKPSGYINMLIFIETSYAERIKNFQEENNIDIEETCRVCKITKEQYDRYMELLNES